jgi:hypothetical protein
MEHAILTIVERIYEMGKTDRELKQRADEICNTYGRRGAHFLKDLYDKYR